MSFNTLLQAIERYIEEEQAALAAATDPAVAERVEKQTAAARRELRREMEALATWKATPHAFSRILVAVDESRQADWALETAIRIARTTGAQLALMHAIPEPGSVAPEFAYAEPAMRAQRRELAEELIRKAADKVPEGVRVTTMLHEGAAPRQVCAAAVDWDADLIVIGTHGRNMIGQLLLGGTAENVVRHAKCPVMTVAHPPAPATELSEEPALQSAGA